MRALALLGLVGLAALGCVAAGALGCCATRCQSVRVSFPAEYSFTVCNAYPGQKALRPPARSLGVAVRSSVAPYPGRVRGRGFPNTCRSLHGTARGKMGLLASPPRPRRRAPSWCRRSWMPTKPPLFPYATLVKVTRCLRCDLSPATPLVDSRH